MGKNNVCVVGPCEGLYYIDNDYIHAYHRSDDASEIKLLGELDYCELTSGSWIFDDMESQWNWENALSTLKANLMERFSSFSECDAWVSRNEDAILENSLFYVAVEDNQWSMAIKLLQKKDDKRIAGLQARHYRNYLDGILSALLSMFESVGTYNGPWTSGTISRADAGMTDGGAA